MSLAARVFVGLILGLSAGIAISAMHNVPLTDAARWILPAGVVWLDALRMTVLPLVLSLLITGTASAAQSAASGRLATRAIVWFIALLIAGAALSALLMPVFLALWPVDPAAAAALKLSAAHDATAIPALPSLREWLLGLIPVNPFEAAASGAVLPLVIFALFFGFAAARIPPGPHAAVLGFFDGVAQTMLVIVRWIFRFAPLGVFALALDVGLHGGLNAAGALGEYVVLMCVMSVVAAAMFYPLVAAFSSVRVLHFARAIVPVQIFGLTTQSSLACLPGMIEVSNNDLGLEPRASALLLPLAVALFRVTSPIVNLSIAQFVAHIYGIQVDLPHLLAGLAVAVITNFAVIGLPSQLTLFNSGVPIALAMGVPTSLLGILLAIEVVPDIFRTIGNVTGDLGVAAILGRPRRA